MSIFPKALTHDFQQKFEISSDSLFFFEKDLDMMFDDVLNRKKAFLTTKISSWQSGTMSIFPKGLTHKFQQKFEISCECHFLCKRPGHDV